MRAKPQFRNSLQNVVDLFLGRIRFEHDNHD
jgi:hypothetical protein